MTKISTHTAMGRVFEKLQEQMNVLLSKRAFSHWYLDTGMEEQDFLPHFHLQAARLVFWDKFGRPTNTAKYSSGFPNTWWVDKVKNKSIGSWRRANGN